MSAVSGLLATFIPRFPLIVVAALVYDTRFDGSPLKIRSLAGFAERIRGGRL